MARPMNDDELITSIRRVAIFCAVVLTLFMGYRLYTDPGPTAAEQLKQQQSEQAERDARAIYKADLLISNTYYVHDVVHNVCYSMYFIDVIRSQSVVPCSLSVKWIDVSPKTP